MNSVSSKRVLLISSAKLTLFRNILLKRNNAFAITRMCSKTSTEPPIYSEGEVFVSAAELRKRAQESVDWLPFDWNKRPKYNPFEESGDLVKELEYDPSWPKPDFELSEELKTANDDIKHMYSLATASKGEIKEVVTRRILEKIQRHPTDMESIEVKAALQTIRIRSLFQHARETYKEKKGGRVNLYITINRRNKKLRQIRLIDTDRFNWICQELKVNYTPTQLGGIREFYCRKWDLRRITKEYCANMIKEKKTAYHQELKQQQLDFKKEKEETLAWIEKEEKEITDINAELATLSIDK